MNSVFFSFGNSGLICVLDFGEISLKKNRINFWNNIFSILWTSYGYGSFRFVFAGVSTLNKPPETSLKIFFFLPTVSLVIKRFSRSLVIEASPMRFFYMRFNMLVSIWNTIFFLGLPPSRILWKNKRWWTQKTYKKYV